ncbi:glycosyltransferase family 2 protein [Polaribacter dokdonensis]|uniref:Glycosyl transferase, family 2 n=1 Tax=Polaribacter dokdonensis DSW-5 TaxID=1300348 RepID=A0A0M9CDV4_9FLAO|nr:glycosyltransferase family 2 protein [Polaribacter dokdonensis]KOY50651.1 Glycosyl transferase, family 2 [Polaribacter dokdonensis DSW-5]SEE62245.1 Glycosyltransferase involved in cell wall bisynthesis [Polaribacter dokdonensis DSW-5]
MKISIITVCYNSEKTIENTIESVISQTYNNVEYIVIDGDSIDNTLNIIKKHQSRIEKWISEPDKGLYDAMNKGIALATGDIIGVLNSDDIFHSEIVLEEIAKFHHENSIDASIGNIVQINQNGKIVRKYSAKNWKPNKLKIGFMPAHPAIFFKRELFDRFGLYQLDYTIGADYELITRFFLKNKITWKFSYITTTSMLIGGLSSSGLSSYRLISKEIKKALTRNNIPFNYTKVKLRGFWKIVGFLNKV